MEEPLLPKRSNDNTKNDKTRGHSQIPTWKLFRYASKSDTLMIVTGLVLSTIAGTSFPLIMIVIGLAITQFTDYIVADRISNSSFNLINASFDYFCPNAVDQGFIDYIKTENPNEMLEHAVLKLSAGLAAIGLGYFISTFVSVIMWSVSSINQEGRIRIAFIRAVLNQDISHYDTHPPTELPTLLTNDIKKIGIGLGVQWDSVVSQLSSILSGFVIAFYFNWKLTLVVSTFIPPLLLLLTVLGKVVAFVTAKEQIILSDAGSFAEQILFSIKTVMAFGGQSLEWERYDQLLQKAHLQSYTKTAVTGIVFAFYNLVLFSIFSLGFWYGGKLFVDCGVKVGDVIIVVFEISVVTLAFGYLVLPLTAIGVAIGSATNVFAVIDQESKMQDVRTGQTIGNYEGSIQLNNVSFSYPTRPDVPILRNIDLNIKPGQTIALVGPSGCGKSTVLKLLQRIYDFNSGSILLDGSDIRELDISWLRSQIGIVSQEPILFNVTVAENIGFGKDGASRREIEAAAKAANAHDFICNLPNGYCTLVGEGGSQLSGGQKQRIAIARALVRDPKILLLDEATSALDVESEMAVQESLDNARINRTTIVIAHRLSTIQTADLTVVIDKGRVVEIGTHADLLAKKGLYHQLVTEQSINGCRQTRKNGFNKLNRHIQSKAGRSQSASSLVNPLKYYSRSRALTFDGHNIQNSTESEIDSDYTIVDASLIELDNVYSYDGRKSSFKHLLKLVQADWWMIALGTVSFCLIGFEISSLYILMSESLEEFAKSSADEITHGLRLYIYLYAGLGAVGFLLHIVGTLCLGVAADKLTKRIRSQCFHHILKQDVPFFDEQDHSVSALVSMLAIDAVNINQITGIPVGFAVRVGFSAIASIVISLRASWVISCVILPSYVVLCVSAVLQIQLGRVLVKKSTHLLENGYKTAIEAIENVYTVSSLGISEIFVMKCKTQFAETTRFTKGSAILFGFLYAFSQSFIYFATSAALGIATVIFVKDSDNPLHADLVEIFQAILSVLFTSVLFNDAFHSLPDTQQAKLSATRVSKLLSHQPVIDAFSDNGIILDSISGLIEVNSCDFSYPSRPEVPVLKGLNFTVNPGKALAIVGPSGSGKSTVVSLLERFYNPNGGNILLDGANIHNLNISWLRKQIALVSQEPVLFDMSIADNIRYGVNSREISDREVHEAAKLANIHDFISSLPQGYNTRVGLKGTQLSGGQKQRVAIARALVRDPKILLLDEATSALDSESEKIVQVALDQARVGRTTIIIAHRLSTIYNSDEIVVLQDGQIVEQGKHEELMERKGVYYVMNNVQEHST